MSRKSRKVKKKRFAEGVETGGKPSEDHSHAENEVGICGPNQLLGNQPPQIENLPNTSSVGKEGTVAPDNDHQHEKNVEEDENSLGDLAPVENKNSEDANEDVLYGSGDFSGDEQLTATNEVDFKVSALVSAFANHSIIQKICWLLKFYQSNSLATNHYIICMLRRISDDLELQPMLYQVNFRKHFHLQ